MTSRKEIAEEKFLAGFNCTQAVVSAFAEDLELEEEELLKLATGFGGGMGRMQNTCGAVTGAFMIIGCLNGKYKAGDDQAKENTYKLVQKFVEDFKEIEGTINCLELMDCDFSSEAEMEKARKNNLFAEKCLNYVHRAVGLLEENYINY